MPHKVKKNPTSESLMSRVKGYLKAGKDMYTAAMSPIKPKGQGTINKNERNLLTKVN